MLEVRNLYKVYKPKKGVPVTALNHINILFPDKGMVFLLGKSGSGKSTLLNLLGGLDAYTEGEIIIKGVSSKDFKQKHFDSYRNTYVGFIFQEYNILEEFSVGANIALALELQGQKATDERINQILTEVDLEGYGNRKPNELSGGQKQRVAIARALIKNPEIIMADEPTGALDSNTGKQVFDTLKKLSKDKLVIIVSHDREFSEQYADRIIELADGNVISDVEIDLEGSESEEETATEVSTLLDANGNEIEVSRELTLEGNTISIEAGYHLTEEDRKAINAYMDSLEKNENLILSKKVHRYRDVKFKKTDESKIAKRDGAGFHLIKSKLPMKNAFKIGASSLKYKKFRLVMTILLSCIAFGLFGMADTFGSYNHVTTCTKSLMDSGVNYASLNKQKAQRVIDEDGKEHWSFSYAQFGMNEEDQKFIKDHLGLDTKGVFVPIGVEMSIREYNDKIELSESNYNSYMVSFSGFAEFSEEELKDYGCSLLKGNMPDGSKNEIAISAYALETFKKAGYSTDGKAYQNVRTADDIIGRTITLGGVPYTVTGVVDTGMDFERYSTLNESMDNKSQADRLVMFALNQELRSAIDNSLTGVAMVGKGFVEKKVANQPDFKHAYNILSVEAEFEDEIYLYTYAENLTNIAEVKRAGLEIIWLDGEKKELSENELVLPLCSLRGLDASQYKDYVSKLNTLTANYYGYDEFGNWLAQEYSIVGFIDGIEDDDFIWSYCMVAGDTLIQKNCSMDDGIYSYLVGSMPKTTYGVHEVVDFSMTAFENDDRSECTRYSLQNPVTYELDLVNELLKSFARVSFFIGLGFAVFASIMLANFIATSINYKKQEIGILRAIGSRGNDVFRIFFSESFIIAMINFVLSTAGVFGITMLANYVIRLEAGILITVLNFGIRQVVLLFVVSLLVAALASFFPVKRIASKRPIDAIRNR